MSKNSSTTEQHAVRLIDQILAMDAANPHAIKGSALSLLKEAKRVLLKDVRRRREGSEREITRRFATYVETRQGGRTTFYDLRRP